MTFCGNEIFYKEKQDKYLLRTFKHRPDCLSVCLSLSLSGFLSSPVGAPILGKSEIFNELRRPYSKLAFQRTVMAIHDFIHVT